METDPRELSSVYDDPAYASVRKQLEVELQRLRDQYKDDGSVVKFDVPDATKKKRKQA